MLSSPATTRRPLPAGPARRVPFSWWLAGAAVFLITAGAALRLHAPFLHADGTFYFIQLRSLYFDRDIDFRNDARRLPWVGASYGTPLPDGRLANPFPIGSALLWSPFYAAADAVCRARGAATCEGYSVPYLRSIVIGTVFWSVLGAVLNVALLKRLAGAGSTPAVAVFSLALTSPLVFYVLQNADYSHGNSYFAASLALYCAVRAWEEPRAAWFAAAGCAVGLAFLVRWQDSLFWVVPLTVAAWRTEGRQRAIAIAVLIGGAAIAAAPQLVFWNALYGKPFTIPQTGNFLSWGNAAPFWFFFSTWNGVFLWHPVLLLAIAGLVVTRSVPRPFLAACVTVVALELVLSMIVEDWWSGGSFGQRRLVSVLPILTIGLDAVLRVAGARGPRVTASLGLALCALAAWNLLTLARYYQGRLPFNPPVPDSYESRRPYRHADYGRRFADILFGRTP